MSSLSASRRRHAGLFSMFRPVERGDSSAHVGTFQLDRSSTSSASADGCLFPLDFLRRFLGLRPGAARLVLRLGPRPRVTGLAGGAGRRFPRPARLPAGRPVSLRPRRRPPPVVLRFPLPAPRLRRRRTALDPRSAAAATRPAPRAGPSASASAAAGSAAACSPPRLRPAPPAPGGRRPPRSAGRAGGDGRGKAAAPPPPVRARTPPRRAPRPRPVWRPARPSAGPEANRVPQRDPPRNSDFPVRSCRPFP